MKFHCSRPLWSFVLSASIASLSLGVNTTPAEAGGCCQFDDRCNDGIGKQECKDQGGRWFCLSVCSDGLCKRGIHFLSPVTPDSIAPSCALTSYQGGPPTQIGITAQDSESGLDEITVMEADNASVTVPGFSSGTTQPVMVTATKIDQSLPARVNLAVGDVEGNCTSCDPILTHILTGKGHGREQSFTNMDALERVVTLCNGSPGLRNVEVLVNGRRFRLFKLKDGERRTLDISRAMLPGDHNVLVLRGNGNAGSRADIIIWDGGGNR